MARSSSPHADAIETLSDREREVLDLIAKGRTNPQIGEELGLTFATAKWYVSEVISKLGVASREEAAEAWRHYRSPRSRALRAWQGVAGLSLWKAAGMGAAAVAGIAVVAVAAIAIALDTAGGDLQPGSGVTPGNGLPSLPPPATPLPLVDVASGATDSLPVANRSDWEWSPDGRYAVASEPGAGIVLADVDTGERWQVHEETGWVGPFSPDSKLFVVGVSDQVIVLDLAGHEHWRTTAEVPFPPTLFRFEWSPDGETLAIGTPDNAIETWRRDGTTQRIEGRYWDFAWRGNNELVAVHGKQGEDEQSSIQRIELGPDRPQPSRIVALDEGPTNMAVAPGGETVGLVQPGATGPISSFSLIDTGSGETQATFDAMPGAPHGTNFPFTLRGDAAVLSTNDCKDGPSEILLGYRDGSTRTLGDGMAVQAAFSPDGEELVYTYRNQLWVVPVDGSEQPRSVTDGVITPGPIRWSPDGERVAYIGGDGRICP